MIGALPKKPFSYKITHKRIELALANTSFASQLWSCIEDDKKNRNEIWQGIRTLEETKDYLAESSNANPSIEIIYLIFLNKALCIGTVHIHTFNYLDYSLEIGYWINKKYEAQGYMSESLEAAECEIRSLGFHRVEIKCSNQNLRSIQLAKKNGYILEKITIHDSIGNGEFRDTCQFTKILYPTAQTSTSNS